MKPMRTKSRPDIRALTRLVPSSGNLVQGQSELTMLCIADEVYEHYVVGSQAHISIATLPGMWERTITVNSFSKSWNISGWRLGYVYGDASLVSLNKANSVFYVCSPTPLQRALSEVLMVDPR